MDGDRREQEVGDLRQFVEVGGDGFEDAVRQVLQVDDGDVDSSLDFRVGQGFLRRNLIG